METRGSYLRRIEEMKKRERVIQRSTTKPYDPSSMNVERMPFGCWVILGIIVVIILSLAGVIKIFH